MGRCIDYRRISDGNKENIEKKSCIFAIETAGSELSVSVNNKDNEL
ncbi:MAG: hypothetical protein LBT50_05980 [Prevotellaceae bacterium]|jgi:hypothetical protein|nr:hypothetical protein [Prevotellaceae bacterium]